MKTIFPTKQLLQVFPVIGCGLALAACAMNPADARSSTPERSAEVGQICRDTMQLNPANADYDMCKTSLLQTLAGLDRASLVERDRQACLQRGLTPATREFALCVVDAEQTAGN